MRILLTLLGIIFYNFLIAQFTYLNNSYNPNNTASIGNSIIEYNGSYYMTGATTDSIAGYQSIFISSIEEDGTLNFWKTYGGYPYAYWSGYTNSLISTTSLGELVLAGGRTRPGHGGMATYYNFNASGDTIYTKYYPDTVYSEHTSFDQVRQTIDGGFIFVGRIVVQQYDSDILIIKTDHAGNEEWHKYIGKPITWSVENAYNVMETADSGFLIGYYYYIAGQEETGDPYMLKVDKNGNFEWEVNLGGPFEDYLATACHSNDGNYMCAASITDSVSSDYLFTKVNVFKLSPDGNILWSKTVGDLELTNKVYGIYQDHNSGYIMCGLRYEKYENSAYLDHSCGWICKIDEDGDSLWWREYRHFTDPEYHFNKLYDLHLTSDGGYVAIGETIDEWGPQQTWVMKVDSFGCDTPDCQLVKIEELYDSIDETLVIYPIPASIEIQIDIRQQISDMRYQISIYDLFGRKQDEVIVPGNQSKIRIDVSNCPSGIYVAILKDEKRIVGRGQFVVKH